MLETLGAAMQALQIDPELTGPGVGYETVHVSLDPLTTEETSRIWALFPTANYRTSVAYIASPVWIDPMLPATSRRPVVNDILRRGRPHRRSGGGAMTQRFDVQSASRSRATRARRCWPSSCSTR